jgi:hypothetical protein
LQTIGLPSQLETGFEPVLAMIYVALALSAHDGAAVLVSNIRGLKDEIQAKGAKIGDWRVDEQDCQKYQVFLVVAPDVLCYYLHEPVEGTA